MNGTDIRSIAALRPVAQARGEALDIVADEIDALDAWRDAKCARIHEHAPQTDLGWWGCGDGGGGEEEDETGSNHADACPVEIARRALIVASDRRRAL